MTGINNAAIYSFDLSLCALQYFVKCMHDKIWVMGSFATLNPENQFYSNCSWCTMARCVTDEAVNNLCKKMKLSKYLLGMKNRFSPWVSASTVPVSLTGATDASTTKFCNNCDQRNVRADVLITHHLTWSKGVQVTFRHTFYAKLLPRAGCIEYTAHSHCAACLAYKTFFKRCVHHKSEVTRDFNVSAHRRSLKVWIGVLGAQSNWGGDKISQLKTSLWWLIFSYEFIHLP